MAETKPKRKTTGATAPRRKSGAAGGKKKPVRKPAKGRTAAGKARPGADTARGGAAAGPRHPLMNTLYAEHRHIASVMQLLSDQLAAMEADEPVDSHVVYETLDYMVSWPDRYHHPREDLIYGRAAELDAGLADSVDSLQRDHDNTARMGREVLDLIERWREGEASPGEVVASARAYIDHMYQHMNSEEQLVFPQVERVLGGDDWRELAEDDHLRPVADPLFGQRVQREYRNLARKLRRNVRRSVERGTLVEWLSLEAVMESLDVLSMAYDSARDSAGNHLRAAWDDGLDMFRESALTAPWRCAANNARLGLRLLQEVGEISRDAISDIARVNRERKERLRLLDS